MADARGECVSGDRCPERLEKLGSQLRGREHFGIDPFACLGDVLTRLPQMTNQNDIVVLTPARWKPAT